jgi:carboxyl-terminal processing protease
MNSARRVLFVLSVIAICAVLGGVYGRQVEATTSGGNDSGVQASLSDFTRVYALIEANYAAPLDPDRAIYGSDTNNLGAIPGMLRTLDPHSTFFDPTAFADLREEQTGTYFGVGMSIIAMPGKMGKIVTRVVAPIPGSPAFRAGLRPGDIIDMVDGKSTEGLSTEQVASLLKGPRGTQVHVTVIREGWDKPLEFTITRAEISQKSVDDAFFIRPGVAFIHIRNFNETTNTELADALKKLNAKDLKGLILDLRDNPGGLLQEAVEVSDHFLKKGQLIVYHEGRSSKERRYYATHGDGGRDYPIVVLINRMTASAAEIVTGALQDHDRALVMGQTSFGKGLVQTVFPLSDRTGLALTTAHYYTPSGRLIQRPYSNISLYDYYYHDESQPSPHTEVRLTDGGREVYGGGGITPDIKVPPTKLNEAQKYLAGHNIFLNFAESYLGVHKTVPEDFQVTGDILQEFQKYLANRHSPLTPEDIKNNLDYIKEHIRVRMVEMIYGQSVASRIRIESDPLIEDALNHLDQAKALVTNAKKYMAERHDQ